MLIQHTQAIVSYIKNNTEKDIFPRYEDRSAWDQAPKQLQGRIIANAEALLDFEWPQLKASMYLDFYSSGLHGSPYHKRFMKRRNILGQLLMAECVEGKGRFMKDIINGVFCICEESTWVVPQHNAILNKSEEIDKKTPFKRTGHIDLFAAETASLLTWCNYFLRNQFDALSPNISKRIDEELMDRIIEPYLESDDFHWMGFSEDSSARGNWTPWINCNCLIAFMYGCKDKTLKCQGIEKTMRSTQLYLDYIGEGGGCNEGPVYWTVAAGMAFDMMDVLYRATDRTIDLFDNQKFKNMGKYIYRLFIGHQYYVNFADAPAKDIGGKDGGLLYRYGVASGDERLQSFGKSVFQTNIVYLEKEERFQLCSSGNSFRTYRNFWNLFDYTTLMEKDAKEPYIQDAYIEDVEVVIARESDGNEEGFFLAAKGGHNRESHNHNDVGHFVLFHQCEPVCIDPGALPYSLDYFNEKRYTFWATRSDYHNLPVINGQPQMPGEDFAATDVIYETSDDAMSFKMDLASCYPSSAKVKSWQRSYYFDRSDLAKVSITDQYELEDLVKPCEWVFMTPRRVTSEQGALVLEAYEGSPAIDLIIGVGTYEVTIEAMDLRDNPKMSAQWGETLNRVHVVNQSKATSGIRKFEFQVRGK